MVKLYFLANRSIFGWSSLEQGAMTLKTIPEMAARK